MKYMKIFVFLINLIEKWRKNKNKKINKSKS